MSQTIINQYGICNESHGPYSAYWSCSWERIFFCVDRPDVLMLIFFSEFQIRHTILEQETMIIFSWLRVLGDDLGGGRGAGKGSWGGDKGITTDFTQHHLVFFLCFQTTLQRLSYLSHTCKILLFLSKANETYKMENRSLFNE